MRLPQFSLEPGNDYTFYYEIVDHKTRKYLNNKPRKAEINQIVKAKISPLIVGFKNVTKPLITANSELHIEAYHVDPDIIN